jgi:WD40 repeat protein
LDGRLLQTLQVYKQVDKKDDVFDVSFSPDGKALASASFDGTVNCIESEFGRFNGAWMQLGAGLPKDES